MELRAQFARLSGELRRRGGRIMGDTRGMAWKIIANWKITMPYSWVNPLFLWPGSIAFCMFTRGYHGIKPFG